VTKRESDIENIKKIFGKFFEVNPPFYLFLYYDKSKKKECAILEFLASYICGMDN